MNEHRASYRSEFADDPDMRELVELFVGELPERMAAVREAFGSGDAESLRRLAHQLKGAGSGYGFGPISEAAGNLERSVRVLDESGSAPALEAVAAEVDELLATCTRVMEHA